jgi:hypothetical protein
MCRLNLDRIAVFDTAVAAIAHTLLKIAYQVLKSGTPYQEPGADFCTRRESPEQKQAWLERQLQKLHPGCTIIITVSPPEAALPPGANQRSLFRPARSRRRPGSPAHPPDKPASSPSPRHRTGQGLLPRAHQGPSCRVSDVDHRRAAWRVGETAASELCCTTCSRARRMSRSGRPGSRSDLSRQPSISARMRAADVDRRSRSVRRDARSW